MRGNNTPENSLGGIFMSNSRQKPNRLVEFLNGKGFYLILVLCAAAVGISGYVLFFGGDDPSEGELLSVVEPSDASGGDSSLGVVTETNVVTETLTTAIPDGAIRPSEVVMSTPSDTAETSSGGDSDGDASDTSHGAVAVAGDADIPSASPSPNVGSEPSGAPSPDTTKRPTASFFVWPLNGEVMVPFSIDELVFSNTMSDWRVHTGADIAGSLGALVCAAGAGVVEDVYTDEMMGATVVIDHGNSVRTVYRNLDETVKVAVGDEVAAGDTIGAVGATADAESADGPHLHFEVIEAGAQIDPLDILP